MSAPNILVVDDESDIRNLIEEILSEEGYSVTVAADADEARASRAQEYHDLVLLDVWMPGTDGITLLREWSRSDEPLCPVVIMSGHGTVDSAVEATRLGAFDFIEKPLSLAKLLHTVERALQSAEKQQANAPRQLLPQLLAPVGRSKLISNLRDRVKKFAAHGTPALIVGEIGTGREAFARFLHASSPRAKKEFVSIAAGTLTEENSALLLFGREENGQVEQGLLDKARGGTLFLNELTDLAEVAQRSLLSALEQGSFVRVNGRKQVILDACVVASAAPTYQATIDSGELRGDLLAYLKVLELRVPPLREYAEDVPELLRYYVDKLVDSESLPFRRFGVAAQNRLRNYPWPHNVRELKNLVHRLLMTGGDEEISLKEIEAELSSATHKNDALVKQDLLALPLREAREHFERAYLTQQLVLCDGKVGRLAKRVGMERTHLYRKLRTLGIDFRQAVAGDE